MLRCLCPIGRRTVIRPPFAFCTQAGQAPLCCHEQVHSAANKLSGQAPSAVTATRSLQARGQDRGLERGSTLSQVFERASQVGKKQSWMVFSWPVQWRAGGSKTPLERPRRQVQRGSTFEKDGCASRGCHAQPPAGCCCQDRSHAHLRAPTTALQHLASLPFPMLGPPSQTMGSVCTQVLHRSASLLYFCCHVAPLSAVPLLPMPSCLHTHV